VYTLFLDEIFSLPQKEAPLRQLQQDLEKLSRANLSSLTGSKFQDPKICSAKSPLPIFEKMSMFEELVWMLQQQACYLASLSMCVAGNRENEEKFYRIVDRIFYELEDPRTLHLFMALLKLIISKEVEGAKVQEHVLHPKRSRAFHLMSNFALKSIYYEDLVHPFLDHTRKPSDKSKPANGSLLHCVDVAVTKRQERYALSLQQFERLVGPNREKQEIAQEFTASLEKFKDFMANDFLQSIEFNLPENIQKLFHSVLTCIRERKFQVSQKDITIAKELQQCESLLTLYLEGIVLPILENMDKYGGPETFLEPCTNHLALENMLRIAEFLRRGFVVEGGPGVALDPQREKFLMSVARQIKPGMLRYLMDQATACPDDIETKLTEDLYASHFSLTKHTVALRTTDLLTLSNLIGTYATKIRLTGQDAVEALVRKIGYWDDAAFKSVRGENDVMNNLTINKRWLFTHKQMVICRTSRCPVPSSLSTSALDDVSIKTEIVKRFNELDRTEEPRCVLEGLFNRLPMLESDTMVELREEFLRYQHVYSQSTPPDFEMSEELRLGVTILEARIQEEASVAELLDFMTENLISRNKHKSYLESVDVGKKGIFRAKEKYDEDLRNAWIQVKAALNFAITLQLPSEFEKVAREGSRVLTFMELGEKEQRFQMPDGCSMDPTATYKLSTLKNKGVVKKLMTTDHGGEQLLKNLTLTFRATSSGGVDVMAHLHLHKNGSFLYKRFHISEQELQIMAVGSGTDKDRGVAIGDGFLLVGPTEFRELVKTFSR